MNLNQYFSALRKAHGGVLPLDDEQKKALAYDGEDPLWIMAGPGTGKTHTLVWLVFKRILVDEIPPESIILTTFTRKASAELQSRLILDRQKLIDAGVDAEEFEITRMNVGTLHGLCSHFLQGQRYEPTLRIRVLEDELTQQFFVRHSRNPLVSSDDRSLWQHFGLSRPSDRYPPNMAKRTEHACRLFNRITENSIDVEPMLRSRDPHFVLLAQAYKHYKQALYDNHRTDQANLQRHFLNFLATSSGKAWLGDGFTVLVDEYQDTNLIQEEIYFTLAGADGDLTVVGDDDQSLYRFRGAIVESLIEFDVACQEYLGKYPERVYLHENRRSHPAIVEWINRFIGYHPEMTDDSVRVRVSDKPPLESKSDICGAYPAIMSIYEGSNPLAATKMVQIIEEIRADGLVADYSQIALLSFSTRETPQGIGAFTSALREARIPIYNPRNHITQRDVRFQAMIGALSKILDPGFDPDALPARLPRGVPEYISSARQEYTSLEESGNYPELEAYVNASVQAVQHSKYDPSSTRNYLTRKGGRRVTISGLLFKLLAHEPFSTELNDVEGGERLRALNLILADYESIYDDGELKIELVPGTSNMTRIERWTLYNFYSVFIEGIHDDLNDPEDDEVSIQPGMINVMTVHQAKGLEFEVVFVLRPDNQPSLNYTHVLEDLLDPFITRPTKPTHRSQELRAAEDTIRLFFVAYSRAKRLLILTGSGLREWDRVLGKDIQGNSIHTIRDLRRLGVHRL